MWWLMSLTMQCFTQHYLTFSFTPLSSSFGIWIFSSHVVAYIVGFESRFETQKSDIIHPRYELFNACGGLCPSLPCLCHYVTFSFTLLSSSFGFYCMWWLMSLTMQSLPQHYLTFSFTPLTSSFGIWIFSSHVVAYVVSFDSLLNSKVRYQTTTL